jgi:hypothetical protein
MKETPLGADLDGTGVDIGTESSEDENRTEMLKTAMAVSMTAWTNMVDEAR